MPNIIEVKDLRRHFGGFEAVKGISFSVPQGTIFGFLGPNGAGKSTTIKMLTTLLRPTSGTILIDGYDPTREPDAVRRAFGIVFQDASLDEDLTAWENMELHGVLYGFPATPGGPASTNCSPSSNSMIAVAAMCESFPAG
jgi:ABC-2 type transport system ATP-binding protein